MVARDMHIAVLHILLRMANKRSYGGSLDGEEALWLIDSFSLLHHMRCTQIVEQKMMEQQQLAAAQQQQQ